MSGLNKELIAVIKTTVKEAVKAEMQAALTEYSREMKEEMASSIKKILDSQVKLSMKELDEHVNTSLAVSTNTKLDFGAKLDGLIELVHGIGQSRGGSAKNTAARTGDTAGKATKPAAVEPDAAIVAELKDIPKMSQKRSTFIVYYATSPALRAAVKPVLDAAAIENPDDHKATATALWEQHIKPKTAKSPEEKAALALFEALWATASK